MDEIWVRAGLIGAALAVVASFALGARRGNRGGGRTVGRSSLAAGVYLFTSSTCADCDPARTKLESELGGEGFQELAWESHPEIFSELAIDAVPATAIVGSDGATVVYEGQPEEALQRIGR